MGMDSIARQHIRSIASWATIIVTTTVVGYALSLIVSFLRKSPAIQQSEGFDLTSRLGGGSETLTEIITILIGLFINFFLFRFATQAKAAIEGYNQEQLASGFRNLKIYFMITTILAVIVAGILILGMVALAVSPPETWTTT